MSNEGSQNQSRSSHGVPPRLIVRAGQNREYAFSDSFRIGRGEECEVVLDSIKVSRVHAKAAFEHGHWHITDLQSTNGTYVGDEKVSQKRITTSESIQFGLNGPIVEFVVSKAPRRAASRIKNVSPTENPASSPPSSLRSAASEQTPTEHSTSPKPRSVEQYIDHYFNESDRPAGEHTQFIRTAFQVVQTRQQKRYTAIIIAIAAISIAAVLFALLQHQRKEQLEEVAEMQFYSNKQLDIRIANILRVIEESGVDLEGELTALQNERHTNAQTYDGYIRELGLYRELTPKERAIYDVARIFNESGFGMPASFVGEVLNKIENHWLTTHRERFVSVIERSERVGYTSYIVQTMHKKGLPPEFFYLALQESDLRVDQSGPQTRWGIAKGMWQFIPSTATRFGLQVGPRAEQRVFDSLDERQDFVKSTNAAAAYLHELYGTLAQASGLLVMASYNWGEHRIEHRLSALPGTRPLHEEVFAGIPEDPQQRNYWAFLTTYKNRMPEETKNYVLEIFSAAVIGHNPRLWGLDFDNPLQHHMEALTRNE